MRIIKAKQQTEEWFKARLGKVTGTKLKDVMAKNNLPLIDKLLAELLSNQAKEFRASQEMERGIDQEPRAVKEFEKATGKKVSTVGFCISDEFNFLGHSPDGLIKENGIFTEGVEIKCGDSATHIKYIRTNKVDTKYWYQILNYFLVVETLKKVHFVSYDDRILAKPLNVVTINREDIEEQLEEVRKELIKFKAKLDKYHKQIIF